MCNTCGCGDSNATHYTIPGENHSHEHLHEHEHQHEHDGIPHSHPHTHQHIHKHEHAENENNISSHHHEEEDEHGHSHGHTHDHHHSKEILIQKNILSKNDLLAERNRGFFDAKNIVAINLVSSPGSGKTTILEKSIPLLSSKKPVFVIEGDQQTLNDAERIQKTGVPVIQINTGNGCHLDSEMINKAAKKLNVKENSILLIENVGNLVCPSLFDLGEKKRVVIISVTEGEDKPLKYPSMFAGSQLCIINKMDLAPYTECNIELLKNNALKVNHHLDFIEISAKTGKGITDWIEWLLKL